jgi:hypothetical protein
MLQRSIGNQAMLRLLAQRASRPTGHELEVGGINDPQEAEADRAAQVVMSGGTCLSCASKVGVVQRKTEGGEASGAASAAAFGASAGHALDSASRAFFEPHFGDLSQVHIHDDESAASTAASIGAHAYTIGSDIGFASGEFAPDTSEGRKLIAHELAHVAQGSAIVRRQPASEQPTMADQPVRRRLTRYDIANRGAVKADWYAQFAPQKPPIDPTNISSIAEGQAWVKDLGGFERQENQRFKIGSHLKSMIEHLPPEVWLPSNDVFHQSTAKDSSKLILTGTREPIDTDKLRNKLYTIYLSVDHPAELDKPRGATGLIWDETGIEQFVTSDEQAAADRFGVEPLKRLFKLSHDAFTHRDVAVLEFLFPDEMLEWRRRSLEVQASVEREFDRRTGVFMGALGEGSIKAIGQFFKTTALAGIGMALAPGVAAWHAGRFGLSAEGLASAGWGTRLVVGTSTGTVIGAGTGAVDSAITNAPDMVRGDISLGEYATEIARGTGRGAKWGAVTGAAGEIASPYLRRFWNVLWPASRPAPPAVTPGAAKPNVPVPKGTATRNVAETSLRAHLESFTIRRTHHTGRQ